MTDSPRFVDQLRLRYAPLKQSYEAYGPGMVRSIGKQIWSGSPPKNWWPTRVTVHAVQPLRTGSAGRSSYQSCVWIEAVLTDISPNVPEWLRLIHQLTQVAIDTHTRTHLSGVSASLSGGSSGLTAKSSSASTASAGFKGPSGNASSGAGDGTSGGDAKPSVELPWSLGSIPLILNQAAEAGLMSGESLPIAETLGLWWESEEAFMQSAVAASSCDVTLGRGIDEVADVLQQWWNDHGRDTKAFPIALKQLAKMLALPADQKGR